MNSVFSDYEPIMANCTQETKPSEIYNQLRIAYNQGVKGILDCTRIFIPYYEQEECDILYEIWRNPALRAIVRWINQKIVLELGVAKYQTINVRLRIATGMINNLNLSKNLAINIHSHLVKNIQREMGLINTEDLPF